jgi:manganese transport protein
MEADIPTNEVKGSVPIPKTPGILRRLFSFAGPAYLVSVGYMDPGNWATDLAAGSRYGYALLWVLIVSNLLAIWLQYLSARLGLVSGRDLAQACRDRYPAAINIPIWILCEFAIMACDLAEVIGSAIGLKLLFGIPLLYGVVITALDTFIILFLHRAGIRAMEAFIVVLVGTIAGCFAVEIFISQPSVTEVVAGFLPRLPDNQALYFAIGILGATVMPHNLYLHSSLVQSRRVEKTAQGIHLSLRYNLIDSVVALNIAFIINAAILIMAAATFFRVGELAVAGIEEAYHLLEPIVGSSLAPILFAVALIAAGQSSTITGTLAGQIVMEGFVNLRLQPWLRRIITRAMAIIPAVITIVVFGETALGELLIFSQVVLSLQLSFAIIPLIQMVSDRGRMGAFALRPWMKLLSWGVVGVIVSLNGKLVIDTILYWTTLPGLSRILSLTMLVPLSIGAGLLLLYLILEPLFARRRAHRPSTVHEHSEPGEIEPTRPFSKIAAALDFGETDREVLSQAATLAGAARCPLVLFHVVESAGARTLGKEVEDTESVADRERLQRYAVALGKYDVPVEYDLGFGDPVRALPELIARHKAELLVVGAHGHRGLADWLHGSTIDELRHRLNISVLVVGKS